MALSDSERLFSSLENRLCHLKNSSELSVLVFKWMEVDESQGTWTPLLEQAKGIALTRQLW